MFDCLGFFAVKQPRWKIQRTKNVGNRGTIQDFSVAKYLPKTS